VLIGQADGTLKIFANIGTEEAPYFGTGQILVGGTGSDDIDVGARATPDFLDWDNDGRTDIVVGGLDGLIHVFRNCGCGGGSQPVFSKSGPIWFFNAQEDGYDLFVPSQRSSPFIMDLDGDDKKDLLVGNTAGQLLFYSNVGTDSVPEFSGYVPVRSDGVPIDLPGSPRSRPSVCDWDNDGLLDVLIGAKVNSDTGFVHLYRGVPVLTPQPGDMDGDYDVEWDDFAIFALYWGMIDCGDCGGADLNGDNNVDMLDILEFGGWWLTGVEE